VSIPTFLRPEAWPYVDVEIIPADEQCGPVVDVTIAPVSAQPSLFGQAPTLAELQEHPRATPKHRLGSKLDRAVANKAARLADKRLLDAWALAVKTRDQWKDRKTGRPVLRSRQLDPLRAEAHHIVDRADRRVRHDIRNGLCLSFATHFAVTRHQLRIEGTQFFCVEGHTYIDATFPVVFVRL